MVKLYIRKILEEVMTIDDVPAKWREEVRQALKELEGK